MTAQSNHRQFTGIDCGTFRGHRIAQVGMSDDGIAMFRCRGCDWRSVGGIPERWCSTREADLLERRAAILAAGDGRDLASSADEAAVDHIDSELRALRGAA